MIDEIMLPREGLFTLAEHFQYLPKSDNEV